MSHYDYKLSLQLILKDPPFYALLMAAMRQADSANSQKLRDAFPNVYAEIAERYNRPGGYLAEEETR